MKLIRDEVLKMTRRRVSCGYGRFQELIKSELFREVGYNCGIYGWNFTVYQSKKYGYIIIDSYRNAPNGLLNQKQMKKLDDKIKEKTNYKNIDILIETKKLTKPYYKVKLDILKYYDKKINNLLNKALNI